jgi:hypothetical protein
MGELRSSKLLEVMEASVLYKLVDEKWKKWKEVVWKDGPTKIRYITAVSKKWRALQVIRNWEGFFTVKSFVYIL